MDRCVVHPKSFARGWLVALPLFFEPIFFEPICQLLIFIFPILMAKRFLASIFVHHSPCNFCMIGKSN
jgi:hypothetical protein